MLRDKSCVLRVTGCGIRVTGFMLRRTFLGCHFERSEKSVCFVMRL